MNAPAASLQQPELFAVETVQGFGALKFKEQRFVQALFEGRTQRDAARAAGYEGSDEVVDVCASKLVRRGKVNALMNQAWTRSGASIDDTLRQAAELQRRSFCEAQEATTAERRREAFRQWREASTLIASIHGKLQLKVSADVNVTGQVGFVLPPEALPVLAQMRREAHEAAHNGGRN